MTELLGKQYRVIYADPPWAYRQGGRGAAKNHYHTMTTADICKMPVRKIAGGGGGQLYYVWQHNQTNRRPKR